jgi:ABC-2 type transport system ATP-binding protein
MNPAIDIDALTKRFRRLDTYRDLLAYPWRRADVLAVDRVSLTIGRGELFGLLGPNGAGKTTLIRMLSTALIPSAGSARVAGHDVVRDARRVRESIALVGCDDRSFFPRLTGRQNLEFFAALNHVQGAQARRRIGELLARTGMSDAASRPFHTYSSGMRQKLAVARGLLGEPEVLFLDEPSRSLDPISAIEMRRLISEYLVGELGRTVILATHSLSEAEELCDRLALIRDGRIVGCGTVAELRRTLPHGMRCELRLASMPEHLEDALRLLPGVVALDVSPDSDACLMHLTLSGDGPVLAGVLREVVEHGADVHGCTTREATLEEIYLDKLGDRPPVPEVAAC